MNPTIFEWAVVSKIVIDHCAGAYFVKHVACRDVINSKTLVL